MRLRTPLIWLVIPLLLAAAGCTKYPLSLDREEFEPLSELLGNTYESRWLIEAILQEAEVSEGHLRNDCAVIINDQSRLKDLTVYDYGVVEWPEIDFSRYSLVVGKWIYTAGNQYLASQKIRLSGGSATLFLEIKVPPDTGGTCDVFYRWFGALYPKLPDVPVNVVRR